MSNGWRVKDDGRTRTKVKATVFATVQRVYTVAARRSRVEFVGAARVPRNARQRVVKAASEIMVVCVTV